jgi:dipeptidyl aminopeptidase/acylaminoacyl peptidase
MRQANLALAILLLFISFSLAQRAFTPEDLLKIKGVRSAKISPDGKNIAYTVSVPRKADEKPGSAYSELWALNIKTQKQTPYITGKVNIRSILWQPNASAISFVMRRGKKAKSQVWRISVSGGEAAALTDSKTGVSSYRWSPDGKGLYYTAIEPKTKRQKALEKKGYGFTFYEENWRHIHLYYQTLTENLSEAKAKKLTENLTVLDFTVSKDGEKVAFSATEKNLVDYSYMFRSIYLMDVKSGDYKKFIELNKKLGNFKFSPNGKYLAYTAALKRMDHAVSQLYVTPADEHKSVNRTPHNFRGHVTWVNWKDNNTMLYGSGEGVHNTLRLVDIDGDDRKLLRTSSKDGIVFRSLSYTDDFENFAFVGSTPTTPPALFYMKNADDNAQKMTNYNQCLNDRKLGTQEVVNYKARDGYEVEGLLIKPVDYRRGKQYPLIVVVHGGPESHYSNTWLSRYFSPGQVLAGKGYAVFYPNYRGSTGYGYEYAMKYHYGRAGQTEFNDIADGIDYLIESGLADKNRVGLGGGSYGGYAAAWFGTYYTQKVKAVAMFVGISDLISKRNTTDIPYEELYVHSGKKLEEMWDVSLKASPIYYARQSRSAFLIFGGEDDPRVSPSQSLEMYRRLKMNDKKAVRLVQYPGEGHGNRKQPGQIDVLYRVLDWYDWYVRDLKPLDGDLPPLDISDKYGLELD